MRYLIVENEMICNIIEADEAFAEEIGALPDYKGAAIGETYNPPKPEPTHEEDRDALLIDLDYRMTLMELEVI